MRAGPRAVALAAALLTGACSTGGDGDFGPPTTTTTVPTTTSVAPSTTGTTIPPMTPAGSVTLRATGFTLPDLRTGGTGLRLLVRASSSRLSVRRQGGGGAVSVCRADGSGCVDLAPGATVELAATDGVELRATGAEAAVEEVAVTYAAAARSTTLVTPARPAGACAARPCQASFSFSPGGAGAFVLDARGLGGQPRFVLTAVGPGSNRMLATVEGGGSLSIRATVEAGSEARLLHHQQTADAVGPVTAEISWP